MIPIENPILLDIPEQFETERLILRIPGDDNAEAMNAAIRESQGELRPWMPWAKEPQTLPQTVAYIRRAQGQFMLRTDFAYCLLRKDDGYYLGNCGVHARDWDVPSFEIGYWLRTSEAGKGYMSEAVGMLSDYFMREVGAERMLIRCDSRNKASAAVAMKCGYEWEGTQHNVHRDNDGNLFDMQHYVWLPR